MKNNARRECFGKPFNSFICFDCPNEIECQKIASKGVEMEKENNQSMYHRPNKTEYYLGIAKAVSKRSNCLKRHYGCIIVKNDEIISTGYNGSPRGCTNCCDLGFCKRMDVPHNTGNYSDCHSVHAEQNAMISASREEMIGSTMYLYGEDASDKQDVWVEAKGVSPCPICARMISNAGIISVVNQTGDFALRELM